MTEEASSEEVATVVAAPAPAARSRWTTLLPPGTAAVGAATAITGLAVYGFLGLTARVLGPEQYAPLSVLWSLVFILGPGLFLPFEQEIGRTFAGAGIGRAQAGSLYRRAILLATGLVALVVLAAAVLERPLVDHLFAGHGWLALGVALAVPGLAGMHLLRGTLAGQGRFGWYSVAIGAEGVVRFVACAVLAVLGVAAVEEYGLVVGLAPVLTAIVVALIVRPSVPAVRERMPWRPLLEAMAFLLVGSLLLQILINAGPLAVQLLGGGAHPAAAGTLLAGLALTRIPLYMFQAVQAALIPELAARASDDDEVRFRRAVTRLLGLIAALTVVGVAGALLVGPWAVQLLFGPDFVLGRVDLALLMVASCVMMAAQASGAALVAAHRHARAGLGWVCGAVAFVAVTLLGHDLLRRVELGLVAGAVAAAFVLLLALRRTKPGAASAPIPA